MASSPAEIVTEIATPIAKAAADKIQSQELIAALFIMLLTGIIAFMTLVYGYKFLMRLVDAFKEVSSTVSDLNLNLTKVVDIQSIDHNATRKNQEILMEQGACLAKIETCLGLMYPDLKKHAEECRQRELREIQKVK